MDVNRNNQETEGPKEVVKKENNPLDLSLTKKEDQEHNLEEEDENDSIEVNDDEVKNEVKNEVSLAQSPIFSYHSHTHSRIVPELEILTVLLDRTKMYLS